MLIWENNLLCSRGDQDIHVAPVLCSEKVVPISRATSSGGCVADSGVAGGIDSNCGIDLRLSWFPHQRKHVPKEQLRKYAFWSN